MTMQDRSAGARQRIGFIGLGNMGKPMATNVVAAGFPTTVFDRDPTPVHDLVRLGADQALTARGLAEHSDVICIVVMTDEQTLSLMDGDDGLLAGLSPGTLIVLHSTISVDTCRRVAALAEPFGVSVVDAAVSGAEERSIAGTLTLMVGGADSDVEFLAPLFEVVGSEVFHMGDLGMGQVTKQCNNLLTLTTLQVVEEALRLARDLGVDEARIKQVIQTSTGDSWALRNIDQMRSIAHLYGENSSMTRFGHKDIALVSELAAAADVPIPITNFAFSQREPNDEV
ncbi:MAG: NAD(P)-dependent oxidoreductase [Acidimicrobiales bacterium]